MTVKLTKTQKEAFREALDRFFTGKEYGGLDLWSYIDPAPWENLVNTVTQGRSSYYLTRAEQTLLEEKAGDIHKTLADESNRPVSTIFVRGTGTGEKLKPLIEAAHDSLRNVFLFDLSQHFTQMAAGVVEKARPGLDTFEFQGDFESDGHALQFNASTLVVELGGTLFNISTPINEAFPAQKLQKRLLRISELFKARSDGWLIITQHINPNKYQILQAYDDEYNHSFALNALHLAAQQLETENFSPYNFIHKPVYLYLPQGGVIVHYATIENELKSKLIKNRSALEFKIEGVSYGLHPRFFNSAINSYLPNENTFAQCAYNAGLEIYRTFRDHDEKIAIHLLKYNPSLSV